MGFRLYCDHAEPHKTIIFVIPEGLSRPYVQSTCGVLWNTLEALRGLSNTVEYCRGLERPEEARGTLASAPEGCPALKGGTSPWAEGGVAHPRGLLERLVGHLAALLSPIVFSIPFLIDFSLILVGLGGQVGRQNRTKIDQKRYQKND